MNEPNPTMPSTLGAPAAPAGDFKTLRTVAAVAACVGLAASAALLAPYLAAHGFCRPGGGCDRVAHSAYATVFGIPRAVIGTFAFAGLLALIVAPGRRLRTAAAVVGATFVLEGLHLLALQLFVLHAICPFCVAVDLASVVAGAALIVERLRAGDAERPHVGVIAFSLAGSAAVVAPLLLAFTQPPSAPPIAVAPLPKSNGKMVLREYVDLECPYCRKTHVALEKALAARPDVIVERRHVPLSIHEHAMEAAVAACCAAEQGAEQKFIDALVSVDAPPDMPVCRRVILTLGLDAEKFDACRKSERPKKRIDADVALATETHVEGLPTIDLDGERHIGMLDDERAAALLARHTQ